MKLQRWSFLKELVPLVLCLGLLDIHVFGGRLFTFEPSPLWLLILLIAPRRGSLAGFVCGLTAAAISLGSVAGLGHSWQDLLHRTPWALVQPGLFLFFGVYLGAISESQMRRREFFQQKADGLAAQLDASEVKRTTLERSRIELEKRIAGQGATLLALHENFKKLDGAATEEELLFTLETVLREESGASTCAVWRISRTTARPVAGDARASLPPLVSAVGKSRRVVSAAEWSRHNDEAPGADLAALILAGEGERLVAVLAGCPFVRLTRTFALRFGMLAEHAGLVLVTLRDRELLRRQAALDAESGLVSETYLTRRLNEEVALARRHKTPLSVLACAITGLGRNSQARLETALSSAIRACIRFSDGLAYFSAKRAFVILLPQCDAQGAAIVSGKITANLDLLELRDADRRLIYELFWSRATCDGSLGGDAVLTRLFSALRAEEAA